MEVRYAQREDGPELAQLFASVTMSSDLELSVERDPDFFALYDIQRASYRTVVMDDGKRIRGLGTLMARDAYFEGALTRVGYLGDLRIERRGARAWLDSFAAEFDKACDDFECEVMLTAILDSNRAARWTLVARHRGRPQQPVYRPITHFDIVNVQFTWRRRRRSALLIQRATPADLTAMAALLAEDHTQRPFGYVVNTSVLADRIERWPGLAIESFYVARDKSGNVIGVAAAWDAFEVKRFRVLAYNNGMVWTRRAFNALAWLSKSTRLPPAGGLLRYIYVTHVSIRDDDPAVMTALIDRIYDDHYGAGYHFMTLYAQRNDPLTPAYERYSTVRLPATLYAVSRPGSPYNDLDIADARPGFEMALV